MKPLLKLSLAVALALGSSQVLALGLGQIQVKSALDEPLVAEIPLQLDNLAEAKGLRVGLASDADFARAGLPRSPLDATLRFSVVTNSNGKKVILVTSTEPVGAPYLDFLIEVDTSKGKQLREYTVLLDPVVEMPAPFTQPAPVEAPAVAPVPATPAPPPALTAATSNSASRRAAATPPRKSPTPSAARAATRAPAPRASAGTGPYGPVPRGDTLYHIATTTRPDREVSVNQMMLALQRANPEAFYRDNINTLKQGAILRIPSRDNIDQTSVAEANAEVHRQYADWRGNAARKATVVAESSAAPAVSPNAGSKPASTSDRLALAPPTQGGGSAASRPGRSGGTSDATIAATIAGLKQQLATTKESLTSVKQENNDLTSRVKDMEDISGKNQKLLSMKDAEIAELQRKLADAQRQAGVPATPGTAATPAPAASVASTPSVASSAAPATSTGSSSAVPAMAGSSAMAAAAAPGVAAPATTGTPASAAGKPAQSAAPKVTPATPTQTVEELPWYRQTITWIIGAIVIVVLILLGLLRRRPHPLPEPESGGPSLADEFGASPLDGTPDDVALEIEHEQSLLDQLVDRPDDLDLHLALCRLYYEHSDRAHFESAAAAMRPHVVDPSEPEWREVEAMGAHLSPQHPLFAGATPVVALMEHAGQAAKPAQESEYHFVFDEPASATAEEPAAEPAAPPAADTDADADEVTREHPVEVTRGHPVPGFEDEYAATQESETSPVVQEPYVDPDEVTRAHPVPGFGDEYAASQEPETSPAVQKPSGAAQPADAAHGYSDDPVDTKLDLARAYLDMGDPAGARAMLEEVLNEGTQVQRDEAKRLLDGIR